MCVRVMGSGVECVKEKTVGWRMGKKDVVHSIYTMEYYPAIKRHEIMPFAAIWMEPRNYHTK